MRVVLHRLFHRSGGHRAPVAGTIASYRPAAPKVQAAARWLGPNKSAAKSFTLLLVGLFPTSMRDRTGQRNSAREGSDEK